MDITKKKEHVKYDRSPLIPRVLGEALRVGALGDDTPGARTRRNARGPYSGVHAPPRHARAMTAWP